MVFLCKNRSFLQVGMARVIVTVKPGFEDAVQLFIETGLIWNGGEVPVIGDPLRKVSRLCGFQ